MNTTQKIIKYLAIAFAVFLIVTIISAILTGLYALSNVLGLRNDNETIGEMKTIEIEESQITTLDIDVAFTNLIIKIDDSFKIETNNNNINYNQDNQNIQITEKAHKWFERNYNGDLILYIPETIEFEKVKIIITSDTEEYISKNIFYTAITRARKYLEIYWDPEVPKVLFNNMIEESKSSINDISIFKRLIGEKKISI